MGTLAITGSIVGASGNASGAATYTSEVTDFFNAVSPTQTIVGRTVESGTYTWATYVTVSGVTNQDATTNDLRTTATGIDTYRFAYIDLSSLANAPTKVSAKLLNGSALSKSMDSSTSILMHVDDSSNYIQARVRFAGNQGNVTIYIEEIVADVPQVKATSSTVPLGAAFNSYDTDPIILREDNGKTIFDATALDPALLLEWGSVSQFTSKNIGIFAEGNGSVSPDEWTVVGAKEIEVCSSP